MENKTYYTKQIEYANATSENNGQIKLIGSNKSNWLTLNKDSAEVLIEWLTNNFVKVNEPKTIEFTRVNNDTNGNPRYVCHFYALLTDNDSFGLLTIEQKYTLALKRAKELGGGIVFQSYNIKDTEKKIFELLEKI